MTSIQEKQTKYDELVTIIKTNKNVVTTGLYEIGRALNQIKDRELYLLEFRDFNEFLKYKVEIYPRTAYRCMYIARDFSLVEFKNWGLYRLEIIKRELQEDSKKFMLKSSPSSAKATHKELEHQIEDFKQLNRLSHQIGKKELKDEEQKLKLIRQFEALKRTKETLKIAFNTWIETALKYENDAQILPLISEAKEFLK